MQPVSIHYLEGERQARLVDHRDGEPVVGDEDRAVILSVDVHALA
jgi:hypothetical protein